jgi:IclR helix-turn-helix domain
VSPADGALSGRQPKAVQSALQVLEAVALAGTGVTAKDIAEHLSMPSATTYRLLISLSPTATSCGCRTCRDSHWARGWDC